MNPCFDFRTFAGAVLAAACVLAVPGRSAAAPGAHGPNGEHLDAPAGAVRGGSALPRLEAKSEAFELVAELRGQELLVLVDRYETNEPVLGGKLEIESGPVKAVAAFRAEHGDYAVNDPALVKVLSAPGEHPLVFTLRAGAQSDLLDGTLVSAAGTANASASGHSHGAGSHVHGIGLRRMALIAAGIAAVALAIGFAWWRWRRRHPVLREAEGRR